jgi:hypothetical protein
MGRIIAVVACGFTLGACSTSMPSLLSSSPTTEALRFESKPPGAEVKIYSGQSCRTPCELTVEVAPEISAAFALNGYQPQTVWVRSEAAPGLGPPRLVPNPVYAELRPVSAPSARKRMKKKPAVVAGPANSPVTSAALAGPQAEPTLSTSTEVAASATNYPWPDPSRVKQ